MNLKIPWSIMLYAYNPSYSGVRNGWDYGLRPA
jgi:hypothetical protein